MKKLRGFLLQNLAVKARSEAIKNANTTCVFLHGQPELPDSVLKLKKNKG